jgi:hypothetical protein
MIFRLPLLPMSILVIVNAIVILIEMLEVFRDASIHRQDRGTTLSVILLLTELDLNIPKTHASPQSPPVD